MTSAAEEVRQVLSSVEQAVRRQERYRIVGVLLAEVAQLRLSGQADAAKALDDVALRVEHPEAA